MNRQTIVKEEINSMQLRIGLLIFLVLKLMTFMIADRQDKSRG